MIINRIKLNNIRSYIDAELSFSEGSTLLAGDVGAGKSSILLSIDFALFGLSKGMLAGTSLLRNGAKSGYVELDFSAGGSNVLIRRNLVRSKTVAQDDGFINVNGNLVRGTALELKQHILNLLNYPKESLMKSKSLIYRYTVYTPQEEMKKILQEDNEVRVDALRKIFGIDKYKNIKENTGIFSAYLRDKSKMMGANITDLDSKKNELESLNESNSRISTEISLLQQQITGMRTRLDECKGYLEALEAKIKEASRLKNELDANKIKAKYIIGESQRINSEIEAANAKINEHGNVDIAWRNDLDNMIANEKQKLAVLEKNYSEALGKINAAKVGISRSEDIVAKIVGMAKCPMCNQDVTGEHKHAISHEEKSKIYKINEELISIVAEADKLRSLIEQGKSSVSVMMDEKQAIEINKMKLKLLGDLKSRVIELNNRQDENTKLFKAAENSINGLVDAIRGFEDIEDKHVKCKADMDKYSTILRELEIKHASLNTRFVDNEKMIQMLGKEVEQKTRMKEQALQIEKIRSWLNGVFVSTIDSIEKSVMFRIHNDFNSLFRKWFYIIMGEEDISINIDNEFNPIIEQDGYNIDYEDLSGGEKTSVALAYRLALNQVINNLIVNIKTNDLIILDEPTDGFSDEQIDRIKIVLSELNVAQVIIVSHEPKIEGFVDNVIRVKKENHVSGFF